MEGQTNKPIFALYIPREIKDSTLSALFNWINVSKEFSKQFSFIDHTFTFDVKSESEPSSKSKYEYEQISLVCVVELII